MPEVVFWDTAAFIALGNADDRLHTAAIAVSQKLALENAHILTTDAVLIEVVNTFSKVAWRTVAQRIIAAVRQSVDIGAATVVHVDEDFWNRGWQLFMERSDKSLGLTDCISFVVMQDRQVSQAFTSDHHFEQAGFVRLIETA
ncbi:MAG: PIN domain-containing protein [Anaerolineae bacterium]|nr:MAG: PIN domain-containing protein [Anaerolineae bacterium]